MIMRLWVDNMQITTLIGYPCLKYLNEWSFFNSSGKTVVQSGIFTNLLR